MRRLKKMFMSILASVVIVISIFAEIPSCAKLNDNIVASILISLAYLK